MSNKNLQFLVVALTALAIIIPNSLFVVNEGSRAIKTRFNKVVRDSDDQVVVYKPGLHFKPPFIDSVVTLDARIQTLDDEADRFVTVEKKDVLIDSYVKWRIVDFGKFYTSTGGKADRANDLLRRKISDRLRNEVGSQTISDIVSGSRSELMSQARIALNDSADGASNLGIEVVDVRVNKIELPLEVSQSIYQRMRAERQAVAGEHRAQGQEQAQIITSETDRNIQIILAEANLEANRLRAQGDAQAAQIYNNTYRQSEELFVFLNNLEAYKKSLVNNNSVLLIKPNENSFYRYLFNNNLINTNLRPQPVAPVAPTRAPVAPTKTPINEPEPAQTPAPADNKAEPATAEPAKPAPTPVPAPAPAHTPKP